MLAILDLPLVTLKPEMSPKTGKLYVRFITSSNTGLTKTIVSSTDYKWEMLDHLKGV